MTVTVWPPYAGFAPIATCHWQGIANILAAQGIANAEWLLCPSWGYRWTGGGVLLGGGRWPALVAELFGINIEKHVFDDARECARFECELAGEGTPFVAEVDAYYVTSPYQGVEHVVHTVIVTGRTLDNAIIVDATNNPSPVTIAAPEFTVMRDSPCAGRIDPRLIYIARPVAPRMPAADVILAAVVREAQLHAEADLGCLTAFLDWWTGTAQPINVCRPAAERLAAARLADALAEGASSAAAGTAPPGIATRAAAMAAQLRDLADQLYLVHMVSTHPRADHPRLRARMRRLLDDVVQRERLLHAQLTADAPS